MVQASPPRAAIRRYTWSIGAGALPPGLSLDAEGGLVSGTPTKPGNFPFTAQVTDTDRVSATQNFAIVVNSATLQITPASIPNGTANVPYSFGLNVAGGTAPYNWSLSAGSLLSGFAIDPANGTIAGTPTVPGVYQFTISVIDSNFGMASQNYQFTVQSSILAISPASVPPPGPVGTPYDFGLLAENSTPPLTWSVTSGNLPPGIQLMSSGLIGGNAQHGRELYVHGPGDGPDHRGGAGYPHLGGESAAADYRHHLAVRRHGGNGVQPDHPIVRRYRRDRVVRGNGNAAYRPFARQHHGNYFRNSIGRR